MKRFDVHDKELLPRSLEIGFHSLIRGLNASATQIWHARLFTKPRGKYQPSGADSKISCNVGSLPYDERLQLLGLHSLQRRWLRADLITAFKIFTGFWFFLIPTGRGLRGHPFKVLQAASHRRWRGSAVSARAVKYWNKLPALQLLLSMFSRNGWRKFG